MPNVLSQIQLLNTKFMEPITTSNSNTQAEK